MPLSSPHDSNRPEPLNMGLPLKYLKYKKCVWAQSAELATISSILPHIQVKLSLLQISPTERKLRGGFSISNILFALNCTPQLQLYI